MQIAVVGLWHLGLVTAACLAKAGYQVIAYDPDKALIAQLLEGRTPVSEPGLDDLLSEGLKSKNLTYSSNPNDIKACEVVWIAFDTPVNDQDEADVTFIERQLKSLFPCFSKGAKILLSSQVSVGTSRNLVKQYEHAFPNGAVSFICIPENLRLGKAIPIFMSPDRIVVGLQNQADEFFIRDFLKPFSTNLVLMSLESAEMTKHALNAFLALSVTFINELASLCEKTGADAYEVEKGLKSEERIGSKAYLRPGGPIGGGTLLRDINYLIRMAEKTGQPAHLFSSVLESNRYHKEWVSRKLQDCFETLRGKTVAILGLAYKAGTDTLRRSTAVELSKQLSDQGVQINAFDPLVKTISTELAQFIQLKATRDEALKEADGMIVLTDYSEFSVLSPDHLIDVMNEPLVIDPAGFLSGVLGCDERVEYYSVGRA